MKAFQRLLGGLVAVVMLFTSAAWAEDIDIFVRGNVADTTLPNVIFVLDNTSNWSRQAQKWPGGLVQGQSEVKAIKESLPDLLDKANVGIIEYQTQSNASDNDGAYVRFALQEVNSTSITALEDVLDTIFDNITSPIEQRSSSNAYGYLPYDFYNYLADESQSKGGSGTPTTVADGDAYRSRWDEFLSPLGAGPDPCADTVLIFIGNNTNGAIATDDATNTQALKDLYDAAGVPVPHALSGDTLTDDLQALPLKDFTVVTTVTPGTNVGTSAQCWKESETSSCAADENANNASCTAEGNCSCVSKADSHPGCVTSGRPANRTFRWNVETGSTTEQEVVFSGTENTTQGASYNFDDWAKFLYDVGIPYTDPDDETLSTNINVKTYAIDVFNAQQQGTLSALWQSAAENGGGRYFQANNEAQIKEALAATYSDILTDTSTFAAVSLPLSATNRARVANQVYIGLFRPSQDSVPRWYGNLRRYQLALFDGSPELADVNLRRALIPGTGVPSECAESYWTSDSGDYFQDLGIDPPPLRTACLADYVTTSPWSDLPDGPFVEKGGVAQQIRELEDGTFRTLYTYGYGDADVSVMDDDDAANVGGADIFNYLQGEIAGVDEIMPDTGLRASVHGGIVHSRPLPVRYDSDTVVLYYGADDGLYRAVNPTTGAEEWAFIAPEHYDGIERLYENDPLVDYEGAAQDPDLNYSKKDYFFDGITGELALYDDANALQLAYIYPTMRRGGRAVYAFDVTDPDTPPEFLWRQGCPNLDNDTDCTTGFADIGQTWSTPIGGYAEGYEDDGGDPQLFVAFGGGFDDCLNEDAAAYPSGCSNPKGDSIYILDAAAGTLLANLATDAPVVSDLAMIDLNFDGFIDFAYAATAAGSLYRVNFVDVDADGTNPFLPLAPDEWTIDKIATVSNDELRFFNSPFASAFQDTVIVAVGSGDRERPLEANYPFQEDVQNRFYVLFDQPLSTFVASPSGELAEGESTTVDLEGDTMLEVTSTPDDSIVLTDFDGWYQDLPDRGEQVVNPAVIGGGRVFYNTFQPPTGPGTELCEVPQGIATSYDVNLFDPVFTEGDELDNNTIPTPPVIATVTIPPGCEGASCAPVDDDYCEGNSDCETETILFENQEPKIIEPITDPLRGRVYFSEDIDRQ